MGDYKKKLEDFLHKKKLRKDQCLILVLTGILLCVIALPVDNSKNFLFPAKSDISNSNDAKIQNHSLSDSSESRDGGIEEETIPYNRYWESKLEECLSYVEGAGQVRVLITLKESEGKIVEKDGLEQREDTTETDSAGGSRTVTVNRTEKTTVLTDDGQGEDIPYVVKTTAPVVEGVVVIAQGGDDLTVRQNIIEAIQVLFDIDVNNIRVVKMKKKIQ